jgi:hypothetical protein
MRHPCRDPSTRYSIITLPGGQGEGETVIDGGMCSDFRNRSLRKALLEQINGGVGHVEGAQENSRSQSCHQLCGSHALLGSERSWFHAGLRGSYQTDALRWARLCLTRSATRIVPPGMTMA